VLARSATAVEYIRMAGALYLLYLGVDRLRAAGREADDTPLTIRKDKLGRIYRDGVVVNILNPKTSLFFLSFLPQFVDPSRGAASSQIFILGATFLAIAFVSDAAYALAASAVASAAKRRSVFSKRLGAYASGAIYIGLGAVAALSGRKGG
jgi:threonine/homoserine/homoserine lactone efflux protein